MREKQVKFMAKTEHNKLNRNILFDIMRGMAAIAVVIFHMNNILGAYSLGMQKGYLAVDFFFILSGFVIAANYSAVSRPNLTLLDFLVARIARLWPLFILATILGCIAALLQLHRFNANADISSVFISLAFNGLMLPTFFDTSGLGKLFPLNPPAWSVFFEMLVNIVFFLCLRRLTLKPLLIVTTVFAFFLICIAYDNGGLNGGWVLSSFHVGAARVLFGFAAGMALYLISQKWDINVRWFNSVVLVTTLCAMFFLAGGWMTDCIIAICIFPALILLASKCHVSGNLAKLFGMLGDVSYSVYLLQSVVMFAAAGICKAIFGHKLIEFAPISGIVFVIILLIISYISWRFFEVPSTNYIRKLYRKFR